MNDATGEMESTDFGREVQFLQNNGYHYENGTIVR